MKFAHKLKTARIDKNLTQDQLAYIADISQVTLSHIEGGKVRPTQNTKDKLEKVLGPIDWERTFDEGQVQRQILTN